MATQSGALGLAILDYARELHIGISSFASIGNKADVSSNDLIEVLGRRPADQRHPVVSRELRQPADVRPAGPPRRSDQAHRRDEGGPIDGGPTGSGIAHRRDCELRCARRRPLPSGGHRPGEHAGGDVRCGRAARATARSRGAAARHPDQRRRRRRSSPPTWRRAMACRCRCSAMPRGGTPQSLACGGRGRQPGGLLASASAEHYESALELLLADPVIDSVLAIFVPPIVTDPRAVATAIASAARACVGKAGGNSLHACADAPRELGAIPCYRFPEAAALAIARAAAYGEWRGRPQPGSETPMAIDRTRLRSVVDRALEGGGGGSPPTMPRPCSRPAASARFRRQRSRPKAKRSSARWRLVFLWRSRRSGRSCCTSRRSRCAPGPRRLQRGECRQLRPASAAGRQGDWPPGVRMAPAGVELLVGLVDDDIFGPVVVCGPGGTMVELLGPPAARLLPLTDNDVDDLLREMPGRALLAGHRGQPPSDEPALRRLLHQVSALADCCPEILELDLNPVRLHAHGLSILDVRMRVGRPGPAIGLAPDCLLGHSGSPIDMSPSPHGIPCTSCLAAFWALVEPRFSAPGPPGRVSPTIRGGRAGSRCSVWASWSRPWPTAPGWSSPSWSPVEG